MWALRLGDMMLHKLWRLRRFKAGRYDVMRISLRLGDMRLCKLWRICEFVSKAGRYDVMEALVVSLVAAVLCYATKLER